MQGFPGIKAKYGTSRKEELTKSKEGRPKTRTGELDGDSVDFGKPTSQQVYFEDEVKAAGGRDSVPPHAERADPRTTKILKPPKMHSDSKAGGRQSADQNSVKSQGEFDKGGSVSTGKGGASTIPVPGKEPKPQDRLIRNYLTRDIHVKDKLREYRTEMNQKYPDPQKKAKAEESDQASKAPPAKGGAKKPASGRQDAPSPAPTTELSAGDSKAKIEEAKKDDDSDSDSVIQDAEPADFTLAIRHMKGSPLPTRLADKLREDAIFDPSGQLASALRSSYISNTSAKKTAYQSQHHMMDFKYKEQNVLKVDAATKETAARDLRKRTKGTFDGAKVNSANHNFSRDIQWLHKANPEAVAIEKKWHERDKFFLDKKHHSKLLQNIVIAEDMRREDALARRRFVMAPLK
jgi:hypothetical protein